jgi:hypothetical protein
MLAEAVQQRYTRILLLERAESLGGLWARVPPWQTIQNHPLDFCLQGFTTRKSVWYPRDVLHFIEEYARVQKLQPFIRCSHDVVGGSWSDAEGCWVLEILIGTGSREVMRCRKLVLCTGRHATPIVPLIDTDGSVPMVHSSQFHRWEQTRGKRVVVVGGGASALDLCVNVLHTQENDDPRGQLHWVVRSPRFFSGSEFRRVWPMTILQLLFGMTVSTFILNAAINAHAMVAFGRRGAVSSAVTSPRCGAESPARESQQHGCRQSHRLSGERQPCAAACHPGHLSVFYVESQDVLSLHLFLVAVSHHGVFFRSCAGPHDESRRRLGPYAPRNMSGTAVARLGGTGSRITVSRMARSRWLGQVTARARVPSRERRGSGRTCLHNPAASRRRGSAGRCDRGPDAGPRSPSTQRSSRR